MFIRADQALKSAGVVQSRLKYDETLVAGFAFGMWWKHAPRPTADLEKLSAFLSAMGSSIVELEGLPSDRDRLNHVFAKVDAE